jgi:hypothetical protein
MPWTNTFHAAKACDLRLIAAALVARGVGEKGRFVYSMQIYT